MRILIYRHNAPHPAVGSDGVGRAVDALLEGYDSLGIDVDFYNTHPDTNPYYNIRYKRVFLTTVYDDSKYDIVNFHGDLPESTQWSKKHVRTLHWVVVGASTQNLMYQNKHTVVGVSQACMKMNNLIQNHWIHSALHLTTGHKNIIHDGILHKENYYVWLGGTDWGEQKGLWTAIDIAKLLGVELYIFGSGSNEGIITEIKKRQNEKVKYFGPTTSDQDKYIFLSRAKGLIYPTVIPDGCPMTVVEALCCGCPVYAFDHSSLPELVETGCNGALSNSANVMVKQIVKYKNQFDYHQISQQAQEKFSPQNAVKKYIKIFQDICVK